MLPFFLLGILLVPGKYFPLRQYTPKHLNFLIEIPKMWVFKSVLKIKYVKYANMKITQVLCSYTFKNYNHKSQINILKL